MADQIQIVKQPTIRDVNEVNEELYRFQTMFPFDFFPDTVIIDRFKINIVKHDLLTKRVTTIPLTGALSVKVNQGILMSEIEIRDSNSVQGITRINNVAHADADRLREIVEGIVVGIQQGVNFMAMSKEGVLKSSTNWGAVQVES